MYPWDIPSADDDVPRLESSWIPNDLSLSSPHLILSSLTVGKPFPVPLSPTSALHPACLSHRRQSEETEGYVLSYGC